LGFFSHNVLSVSFYKKRDSTNTVSKMLQRNTGSLLLTGCSPAEPVYSSTSWGCSPAEPVYSSTSWLQK